MRYLITPLLAVVMSVLSAIPAYAGGSTAITYQGRLLDAGEPANGTYLVQFRLWDDPDAGSQIGSTATFKGLSITDGLFSVELDFGADAFDNSDRWLEISVNGGAALEPRQAITRAPYAIQTSGIIVDEDQHVGMGVNPGGSRLRAWNFAGNAFEAFSSNRAIEAITTAGDMAILASNQSADGMGVFAQHQPSQNQAWLGNPDYGVYGRANDVANDWAGYFLGRAHVSDRLFVGRENSVSSAEYFGFNAPVEAGYGGMYISTNGDDAWPFYGYATGGTADCWHYYDGVANQWKLVVSGQERIRVHSDFQQIDLLGTVRIGSGEPSLSIRFDTAGEPNVMLNYSTDQGGVNKMRFYSNKVAFMNTGNVGVSTLNPNYLLEVNGTAGKPGGGSWSNSSDRRLKKNIEDIDWALDTLMQLRGVTFEYKDPDSINELHGTRIGMIAQEVEAVFPDWINDRDDGYKSVTYRGFEALTVEALRALRAEKDQEIDALRTEKDQQIDALRARLDSLESLVERLAAAKEEKTK